MTPNRAQESRTTEKTPPRSFERRSSLPATSYQLPATTSDRLWSVVRRRLVLGLLAASLLIGLAACSEAPDSPADEDSGQSPAVEAVPARFGSLPLEEELSGVVKARNQVQIRPEIAGTMREVLVRNGESVERGQALARLEGAPLQERLRQAEASLRISEAAAAEARASAAEVETRVVRARALAAENLVSDQELETREAELEVARARADQARAAVEEARATVEERRADLSKTVVRAPITGRVGQREVEVGMGVDPSSTLFVLGEFDELVVEVPMTERLLADVDSGAPVVVEARTLAEPIRAEISRISPFLEQASFSTVGEIDIDNRDGRLRPGMFVNVRVLRGESERATLVPASAVWEDPRTGRRGIYVVRDASGLEESSEPAGDVPDAPRELVFRPVEILAEGGGVVGVVGVAESEWVVTVGQHLLHEEARDLTEGADEAELPVEDAAAAEAASPTVSARVRPTSWSRVTELQSLQREDLLAEIMDKQSRIAAVLGAEIPESEDVVDRILGPSGDGDGADGGGG